MQGVGRVRQSRKLEHIKYSLELEDGPAQNGFADITLIHNCLPDISWPDIDITSNIAGMRIHTPVIINAITGGAADVAKVNGDLARLACQTHSAMAVGSQYSALEKPEFAASYQIVRKYNPHGIIFANLGAHASVEEARAAIEMIGADALQIHLNVAQEAIMSEGDRDFSEYLKNIADIVNKISVPVIVKEVGFGIAKEQAELLIQTGVQAIDIGGMGGTNFIAIESARSAVPLSSDFLSWGIPTAISTVEVASVLNDQRTLIASGGIRTPLETIKALSLGASAVGMAGPVLRRLKENGLDKTYDWLNHFLIDMKRIMLVAGAKNMEELRQIPLIIAGYSREWLTAREIDITQYALRKKHG